MSILMSKSAVVTGFGKEGPGVRVCIVLADAEDSVETCRA
jgi:hypothetical protein